MKVRLIELFSGIGAQAKALQNLKVDFEHHRSCEIDENAVKAYNAVHGTNFVPSSITETKGSDLGVEDLDKYLYIMTYSFPCQELSTAGKQRGMTEGSGTRSSLLWEVRRLLEEMEPNKRPQVLLMENVTAVHNKGNFKDFMKWHDILEELGYTSFWFDCNALDYNVPQSRPRCFMVSINTPQRTMFDYPQPRPLVKTWRDIVEDGVPSDFTDLLKSRLASVFPKLNLEEGLNMTTGSYDPSICDKYIHCITTAKGIDRLYKNMGAMVVTKRGNNYDARFITSKEAWQFMGFDVADYEKAAPLFNETQLYKFAGNSIVVDVLMYIFRAVFDYLYENDGIEISYDDSKIQ